MVDHCGVWLVAYWSGAGGWCRSWWSGVARVVRFTLSFGTRFTVADGSRTCAVHAVDGDAVHGSSLVARM